MKKLFTLLFLAPLIAFAQPTPPAPAAATQAEVNAGVVANKYVSPKTLDGWTGGGGGGLVDSVFGRTGDVTAESGDYSAFYGQLGVANTWTAVNTFNGSIIRTPVPITIAANAGTLTITNGRNTAANNANTTITMSAAGSDGQWLILEATNSDSSAHTWTINNPSGTDPTFTAAAVSTTTIVLQSNGTVWSLVGGAPTINDLATVTAATGDFISFWDISGGLAGKATVANIVSTALTGTPATVPQGGTGLATLTSGSLLVGAGTSNVTFIAPGTGVATALAANANATGGFVTAGGAPRILTITSSATPTINTDNCDVVNITALSAAITSMTTNLTGTPADFDQLEFRILDDGTARAITWGSSFASGISTLPTTTVLGKALCVYLEWDAVQAKWMCQAAGSYP